MEFSGLILLVTCGDVSTGTSGQESMLDSWSEPAQKLLSNSYVQKTEREKESGRESEGALRRRLSSSSLS